MKVVILCGGMGMRLQEQTEFIPKPLIKIGDRPILWHIMKIYQSYGFNEFILCLGYKGDMIKNYFENYSTQATDYTLDLKTNQKTYINTQDNDFKITFVETGEKAQTGARIKKIEKYITDKEFFLTYGDGLCDVDINELLKFHLKHKKIGTVTAVRPLSRYGILNIKNNTIVSFTKKTLAQKGRIDGGFFVFNRKIFNYLTKDDSCSLEAEPLQKLSKDKQFMAFKHNGFWQCMDYMSQVKALNEMWITNPEWKKWS